MLLHQVYAEVISEIPPAALEVYGSRLVSLDVFGSVRLGPPGPSPTSNTPEASPAELPSTGLVKGADIQSLQCISAVKPFRGGCYIFSSSSKNAADDISIPRSISRRSERAISLPE